jgi:alpha-L-fucosidase
MKNNITFHKKIIFLFIIASFVATTIVAQDEMWDKTSSGKQHPNIQWFKEAKFGLFIHWGLYSQLAGVWKGKRYYGSGEWIMSQGKISASEYAKVATSFNPVNFDAKEWAKLAKDAGIKYVVITAKHHEGFAMYHSIVSDFNIVDATPYKKDPMKALSAAVRAQGMKFGFYYSQYLDWHESNGGGNRWSFDESKKDYLKYYREKSIPQLKELMTNYGPLGLVWFDMPGGLTKEQTRQLVDSLRILQPKSLFSSRVGQGLGDYKDFGDSEIPPVPIDDVWESIYTHNDSWGYIEHDMDFKSSSEIIKLLANVASKGGNLMLNIGPDGKGNIPYYSRKYLIETGKWLQQYGESIYATTYGFIPAQPWGVTTTNKDKLFLHVFNRPKNNKVLVPGFSKEISKVYSLSNKQNLSFKVKGTDVIVSLSSFNDNNPDNVIVIQYKSGLQPYVASQPVTISSQYVMNNIDAVFTKTIGLTKVESLTYSHYYGDWKHATCVTGMQDKADTASLLLRITDPGDYRIILEYACIKENAGQEGSITFNNKEYFFRTLRTSEFEKSAPLLFIKHPVAITTITGPGIYTLSIHPLQDGKELFKLKTVLFEPIK